jgi:hypothetical protein
MSPLTVSPLAVDYGAGTFLLKDAAAVQAGYGTLGLAGHVFDTVVNLDTTRADDIDIPTGS